MPPADIGTPRSRSDRPDEDVQRSGRVFQLSRPTITNATPRVSNSPSRVRSSPLCRYTVASA